MFVLVVTKELDEWEDSKSMGRKRQWFSFEDALLKLALHKPTQRSYLQQLRLSRDADTSTSRAQKLHNHNESNVRNRNDDECI